MLRAHHQLGEDQPEWQAGGLGTVDCSEQGVALKAAPSRVSFHWARLLCKSTCRIGQGLAQAHRDPTHAELPGPEFTLGAPCDISGRMLSWRLP